MQFTGSPRQQTEETARSAAPRAQPGVPSWGPVLATTVRLWAARRLARLRHSRRALLIAICVLAVGAAGVIVIVRSTGTSVRTTRAARAARGPAHPGQLARSAAAKPAGAAGTARSQAAAWMAGQLGRDETIACEPSMCTALGADGVASTRLLPVPPSASGAPAADVIVAAPPAYPKLSQEAPGLLASFGSGAHLIEVRAISPDGPATYQAALGSDLAARRSAGTQLLHSRRIVVSAQAAGQLQAGEVDSRLLVMLAVLASQHSWRVITFGDASPGVPTAEAPYRQVVMTGTGTGGQGGAASLAPALALVRAQHAPYQPAQVTTVRLAGGQAALRIDFAAPGPLGLLAGSVTG